jgi:hypothetical protein
MIVVWLIHWRTYSLQWLIEDDILDLLFFIQPAIHAIAYILKTILTVEGRCYDYGWDGGTFLCQIFLMFDSKIRLSVVVAAIVRSAFFTYQIMIPLVSAFKIAFFWWCYYRDSLESICLEFDGRIITEFFLLVHVF